MYLLNGIIIFWFHLFKLIYSDCRNKIVCLGYPNLTTINDTNSRIEGDFVGKNILPISQEEGCDI
jgi:hypothetical protein